MKLVRFLFLFLFFPLFLFPQTTGQYEIGLPLIRNYSPKEYKGFSQNWGFVQDSRGVLYFANGDGVLEFDGVHWRVIKVANNYTASSVAIDKDNRVYVGSISEFGYLAPSKNGELKYVSLIDKFDAKDKEFNYILNIYVVKGSVYFLTNDKLYRWKNKTIRSWRLRKPSYCYKYDDQLLLWQKNVGLKELRGDSIVKVAGGDYFCENTIQNILPYKGNKMLIISRDSGMYLMDDPFKLKKGQYPALVKFYNQADYFIQLNQLLYSTELSNGYYAFATLRGGTAIMDNKGALVQILDKSVGVLNDTHNGVGQDVQNALWLSMDNGITRADILSPLTFWNDDMGLKGSVLAVTRFKGKVFAGTWQGLYYYDYSPEKYYLAEENSNKNFSQFKNLKGIKNTTWDLLVIKNNFDRSKDKLLVASSGGVYEVDLYTSKLISSGTCTKLYRCEKDPSKILVACDDGIKCISVTYSGKELSFQYSGKLNGFDEKIVNFAEEKDGKVWIASEFDGVYQLEFKNWKNNIITLPLNNNSYTFTHFAESAGVPDSYCTIYKIKNRLIFVSEDGLCFPVKKKAGSTTTIRFVRDNSGFSRIQHGSTIINYMLEDTAGNIWVQISNKALGTKVVLEAIPKNGAYELITNPFRMIPQMEMYAIFADKNNITWFGGDDGLVKYDGNSKYRYDQKYHALIRKVLLDRDSVLFGGTNYSNVNDSGECSGLDTIQIEELKPAINYPYNHLTFEYAAPGYFEESTKYYKVWLEGFDKKWSGWSVETKKEYTNLPPGKYKFRVVAKNIFDVQSTEADYEFQILAPWYRTGIAYFIYFLLFSFVVFSLIRIFTKRLRDTKNRLEVEVAKRTAEINSQIKVIEKEKEMSDKLLLNILPHQIAKELKETGHAKTKFFEQVTVMFSDFKDFTIIAQQLEPQELISELNKCFMFFDDVCTRHNIEKIKTVGDSFMCAGGVPMKNFTNPVDAILAAFEMRDFISRLKREHSVLGRSLWKIRIGVHTGPIISGVVGKKKFAYDIWGDTVNTASRLEQASHPNKVNISGATYELVKDFFDCTYRGKVPVKHKGEIDMYFAERIKIELSGDDEGRIPNKHFDELYEILKEKNGKG